MAAGWGAGKLGVRHTIKAHDRAYRLYGDLPGIGRPIREGRPYEEVLLEHIYELNFSGTAIDVGAHVGNHSLWLAAVCDLRVVAFEPLLTEQLRRNVQLNKLERQIEYYSMALGECDALAIHSGQGRLFEHADGTIPIRRLDDFSLTDVSLIKVDVEGMEPEVLRGGETTIRRDQPMIFAEEWDDSTVWHERLAEVLEPWGYVMTHLFTAPEAFTPMGKWEHRG